MSGFVHLHNYTHYAPFIGFSTPSELVKKASEIGTSSLAITDVFSCGGYPKFRSACNDNDINPIYGIEMAVTEDMNVKQTGTTNSSLVFLAKNRAGYKTILRMTSDAANRGFYRVPRIDMDYLEENHDGLICLTSNMKGYVASKEWIKESKEAESRLLRLKDVFSQDLFVEIMAHPPKNLGNNISISRYEDELNVFESMVSMAERNGIESVGTNNVRYARRQDCEYYDIYCLLARSGNKKRYYKDPEEVQRLYGYSDHFYLKSEDEMRNVPIFNKYPHLLDNTVHIANMIEKDVFISGGDYVPGDHIAKNHNSTPKDFLRQIVYDGLREKGLDKKPEYVERVEFELRVFETCGYLKYFLVLWDFMNFAKNENIAVGPGRGSAAGSLALYALGVTKLDPIKYELLFDRFLSVDIEREISKEDFGL